MKDGLILSGGVIGNQEIDKSRPVYSIDISGCPLILVREVVRARDIIYLNGMNESFAGYRGLPGHCSLVKI
jgi:hypothetical protein